MLFNNSAYLSTSGLITAYVIASFSISLPFFLAYALNKNRAKLHTPEMQEIMGNLYFEINLKRNSWTIYYFPMTTLRKVVFVAIPTLINNQSWY